MFKNKGSTGFTLIELLVVLAIVGILVSVVLTQLSRAKNRSNDTAAKSGLNQARIQADIYYVSNGNYTNVCNSSTDSSNPKGINKMVYNSGAANNIAGTVKVNGVGASTVRCNDATNGWAAEVPLTNETGYYCVDYTRKGIVTSTSIGDTNGFCQ